MNWYRSLQQNLEERGLDMSLVIPAYTLSTAASYPTQLHEAVESLRYLVETEARDPGDIVVSGDSAGANLLCGLVSHMLHPHPSIMPFQLTAPLRATVFASPWVSFRDDTESYKTNEHNDLLCTPTLRSFHQSWVEKKQYDNYNHPIQADSEWWSGADKLARDTLVWIGGGEVLLDSAQEWAQKYKSAVPNAEIIVTPKDPHDAFLFEPLFGYKEPGLGTKAIKAWVASKL
ncbi:MAG: hypothetical protein M1828_003527 [Chrysothrix sp. TS-e1954]|nr:MAG: hypothetical protein M1828_003527 [Chrysothrix sp. TS-e1954]